MVIDLYAQKLQDNVQSYWNLKIICLYIVVDNTVYTHFQTTFENVPFHFDNQKFHILPEYN